MTDLEKLTLYMNPYYQTDDDVDTLEAYLSLYNTSESAASSMWAELPQQLVSGRVKSFSTGGADTSYHTPKEIEEWCAMRASYYSALDNKNKGISGVVVGYFEPSVIAGGASDEPYTT